MSNSITLPDPRLCYGQPHVQALSLDTAKGRRRIRALNHQPLAEVLAGSDRTRARLEAVRRTSSGSVALQQKRNEVKAPHETT